MADHGSFAPAPLIEGRATNTYGVSTLAMGFEAQTAFSIPDGRSTGAYGIAGTYQPPPTGPFYPDQGLCYPTKNAR